MGGFLIFGFLMIGCVHKKNQIANNAIDSKNLAILSKPKNIGEVLKNHLDDSDISIIDHLENCTKDLCDSSFEKAVAGRLRNLHIALRDKNTEQVVAGSAQANKDFQKLIATYLDQREYIIPVTFQAWFLAGAIYPYSKALSQALFLKVKSTRKILDDRSPKPVGYTFLVALETEYQGSRLVEKVQAYKRCIDAEPSNRRCQEAYLRLSSQSPKAIKASEINLAKECRPEVDKSGFTLKLGTSTPHRSMAGPKPFYGKKYYMEREDFIEVSEIEGIYWNKKGPTINLKMTDSGSEKLQKSKSKISKKGLLLTKKEMIFAAVPVVALNIDESQEIKFLIVDKKGLGELVKKCP